MKKMILVADDDKNQVSMLDVFLTQRGYNVIAAYDGEEALRKIAHMSPSLIILDVQMPKMDGDEVYMALKSDDRTKDIPVLVVTGLRTEDELAQDKQENTFAKPVHFDQLLGRIRELVGE